MELQINSISRRLEDIHDWDRHDRDSIGKIQNNDPFDLQRINSLWKEISIHDSIRFEEVQKIIRLNGLDKNKISDKALLGIFLVIQHAKTEEQTKILPILKKSVKQNRYPRKYYAFHVDRVEMLSDRYQIYGTQFGSTLDGRSKIWPIKKLPTINKRRAEMELSKLEDYANESNISFNGNKIDSFKRKVIIEGIISDTTEPSKNIFPVEIYSAQQKRIGYVNKNGSFHYILNRRILKKGISFFSEEYEITPIYKYSKDKDIYFIEFNIHKKNQR